MLKSGASPSLMTTRLTFSTRPAIHGFSRAGERQSERTRQPDRLSNTSGTISFPRTSSLAGSWRRGICHWRRSQRLLLVDNQKMPPWQRSIPVASVNDGHFGRGVPDVAGNASANSGYKCFVNGFPSIMWGTSAVAPLYAGLIAVINAALHGSVGFLKPNVICARQQRLPPHWRCRSTEQRPERHKRLFRRGRAGTPARAGG